MSKIDPYEHLKISLNLDGSLTRHCKFPTTAPTGDPPDGPGHTVLSRDVPLQPDKGTWLRLYRPARLPSNDTAIARLPVILFFHSGGWIAMSVSDAVVHNSANRISGEVPAIVVSIEYRLAPENRLPAAYDDAVAAAAWVRSNADPWIEDYADLSRCYLYGSACGANIAFNAALRLSEEEDALRPAGTILNQPLFGSKRRTKKEIELANDEILPLPVQDLLWELALPVGADRDHPYSNPFVCRGKKEKLSWLGRCLVIGFGGDPLIDRQQEFVRMLMEDGVPVEAHFDDAGFHMVHLIDPRRATVILNFVKQFV